MMHQRREPGPAGGRGLFVSGIVLGLCLGFAAAHLLLFGRARSEPATTGAAEFPAFDPAPLALPSDAADDLAIPRLEFDDDPHVGRVTLSDRPMDDGLRFFPAAMRRPAADPLPADSQLAFAGAGRPKGRLRTTAELSEQPATIGEDEAPQALEPAPSASPIDERTSLREQLARSIIQEELPQASVQEQDIWYDVLRGLPAEDIRGILRMRKHIRPGPESPLSDAGTAPTPLLERDDFAADAPPPSTGASHPAQTRPAQDVLGQLRDLHRYNLANRQTVGFKQLIPLLAESDPSGTLAEDAGIQMIGVVRDMHSGQLLPTGRTLDVALAGPGFFQVRRGDEVRYTRNGRLTMDEKGRLMLLAAHDAWLIDPPIAIPAGCMDVTVQADGRVAVSGPAGESVVGQLSVVGFLNPEVLRSAEDGLLQSTAAAGAACPIAAGGAEASSVLQRHIECSNVDSDVSRQHIDDLQSLGDR